MRICDVTFGDNGGSAGLVGVEVVLLQQLLLFLHTTGDNGWSGWSSSSSTSITVIAVSTTGDNSGSAGLVGVIHRGKRGSGVGLDGSTMSYLPCHTIPYHILQSYLLVLTYQDQPPAMNSPCSSISVQPTSQDNSKHTKSSSGCRNMKSLVLVILSIRSVASCSNMKSHITQCSWL